MYLSTFARDVIMKFISIPRERKLKGFILEDILPMAKGRIQSIELQKVIEVLDTFDKWQSRVDSKQITNAPLETRMNMTLAGIQMGILPLTALSLCNVSKRELGNWLKQDEDNETIYNRALAYAEAKLEFVVHTAAQADPRLALNLLSRRNPKKWAPTISADRKEGTPEDGPVEETPKTMSEMFDDKKKAEMKKSNFNVNI